MKIVPFSIIFLTAFVGLLSAQNTCSKAGVFVTPDSSTFTTGSWYNTTYQNALSVIKGHVETVWIQESWKKIETAKGVYNWSDMDRKVYQAIDSGFTIGLRIQVVSVGHDASGTFLTVLAIPSFVNPDFTSAEFATESSAFYGALAAHYKGKIKYISVSNSVNSYFENAAASQWTGFQSAFPEMISAIKAADPKVMTMCDIDSGVQFWASGPGKPLLAKYTTYFKSTDIDAVGILFYFVEANYFGQNNANFNLATFELDMDTIHSMVGTKSIYLIETAYASTSSKGVNRSANQAKCVNFLFGMASDKSYILGFSWFELYDANNYSYVPLDARQTNALFAADLSPKPAWTNWLTYCSSITTDIPENTYTDKLLPVYPNPSKGLFTVDLSILKNAPVTIRIVNLLGQQILETNCTLRKPVYDLHSLPSGIYYLSVFSDNFSATVPISIQ